MPKAENSDWNSLRIEWENTPKMTLSEVAERLNVAVPTVSLRARRELWVKVDVVDLERLTYSPTQMVEAAVGALMRAVSQDRDHASAIKAASMLLDRCLGRVATEAPPMLAPAADTPKDWPDWLTARRLAYQESPETPPQALPPPRAAVQKPPKPPVQSPQQESTGNVSENRKTNGAVLFFDRPGLPATGPTRDPNRFN